MSSVIRPNVSAVSILNYWFGSSYDTKPVEDYDLWYGGAKETDEHIRLNFLATLQDAEKGLLNDWVDQGPYEALALIVLLDQFALNAFRDQSRGYDASVLAIPVTRAAVRRGYDKMLPKVMTNFMYMPLMHSEVLDDQEACVRLFQKLHDEPNEFAIEHRDIIKTYGRFPGRNKCHRRANTEAEEEYLAQGGVF
jgi:uncharacterized protein (DUF924 family)